MSVKSLSFNHHGPVFSNLILFWELFLMNGVVFLPEGLLRVLVTLFSFFLSIRLFCYDLSVAILFCFFCFQLLKYLRAFSPYLQVKFYFVVFGTSCFVCIVWSCLGILLVFLFRQFLLIYILKLYYLSCLAFLFSTKHTIVFFLCLSLFACCSFLICVSSLISHLGFVFQFMFFRGTPILSRLLLT